MTSGYAVVAYMMERPGDPHVAYIRDTDVVRIGTVYRIQAGDASWSLQVKVLSDPTPDVWEARADLLVITGAHETRESALAFVAKLREPIATYVGGTF